MNVLYISILPVLDDNFGVLNKIRGQTESMKSNSLEIAVLIFYKSESLLLDKSLFPTYFNFVKYPYSGTKRIFQSFNLWRLISNYCRCKEYDIIYFRNPGSSYFLYKFLKKNKGKIVLEHNSKELEEIALNSRIPKLWIWYEVFFAKKSYRYALGNVGKATEFSMHQESKVGYKLNLKTITNGIDVKEISVRSNQLINSNGILTLIFVGNIAPWHGLERLLGGIKNYKGYYNYRFYLVGNEKIFFHILQKLDMLELVGTNIFLSGFKTGRELDKLFNNSDLAVGSLGLHRINIMKGVPLKHREYLSRGLPFIYSGKDEDINESICKYLFNVSANESPVDFFKLLEFVQKIKKQKKKVSLILMEYASRNIDVKTKTMELIDFFNFCIIQKKINESH